MARLTAEEVPAPYRFRGMRRELDAGRPLAADETVVLSGMVRHLRTRWWQPVAFLRVTDERMQLVLHRAWAPDTIWDIPRAAIDHIDLANPTRIEVGFHTATGVRRIALAPARRVVTVPPAIRAPMRDLAAELRTWREQAT